MKTDRELLQMALDNLRWINDEQAIISYATVKDLRDRLAHPDGPIMYLDQKTMTLSKPLKHEWVGLTDEEREQLILGNVENVTVAEAAMFKTVLALQEAKLKERNFD